MAEASSLTKLDSCTVQVDPPMTEAMEHLRLPHNLMEQLHISADSTPTGLVLTGPPSHLVANSWPWHFTFHNILNILTFHNILNILTFHNILNILTFHNILNIFTFHNILNICFGSVVLHEIHRNVYFAGARKRSPVVWAANHLDDKIGRFLNLTKPNPKFRCPVGVLLR